MPDASHKKLERHLNENQRQWSTAKPWTAWPIILIAIALIWFGYWMRSIQYVSCRKCGLTQSQYDPSTPNSRR